jgi:SOS response regulatory protein OraA/RecX
MGRVSALRRPRAGSAEVDVLLEGGERVRVHERRVAQLGLYCGDELDAAELTALRRAAVTDDGERRLLRLMQRRPRSRAESERRLAGWGVGPAGVTEIVGRLAAAGLLDDAVMARAVSSSLRGRGHGHLRAAADMHRYGLAEPAGQAAVQEHAAGDLEAARAQLRARYGGRPQDAAEQRRAAAHLARRGFDEDTIAAALGLEPWE